MWYQRRRYWKGRGDIYPPSFSEIRGKKSLKIAKFMHLLTNYCGCCQNLRSFQTSFCKGPFTNYICNFQRFLTNHPPKSLWFYTKKFAIFPNFGAPTHLHVQTQFVSQPQDCATPVNEKTSLEQNWWLCFAQTQIPWMQQSKKKHQRQCYATFCLWMLLLVFYIFMY